MHITYPINALPRAIPLCLGVQSEYGARPISIDVSAWVGRWPDIVVSIQVVRPGEDASYPAVDVTRDGNVVTWTPNAYDTEIPGSGSVEIVGLADSVKIIRTGAATSITATLTSTSKVPEEPLAAWADSILKAGERAKMDADRAADAADDAQRHAGDALASAESAASSAGTSDAKAAEAAKQANDAKASANTAQQHADAAAASAQAAAGSAADLDEAVNAAAASAQSAANYRTLAGQHAAQAANNSTHAMDAAKQATAQANVAINNAMAAEGSAYAASQSAQQANTSAATAASRATEAAASATKSQTAADMAAAEVTKAEAAAAAAESAADRAEAGATAAETSAQASADDASRAESAAIRAETALANISDDYTALAEAVRHKGNAIVNEKSDAMVSIADAEATKALSMVSHITAFQRGKGDPTPDNERQFLGWDMATVVHTGGKNLLGGLAMAQVFANGIPNAVIDEANATVSYKMGDVVTSIAGTTVGRYVPFQGKPNTRYTIFLKAAEANTAANINMRILYADGSSSGANPEITNEGILAYTTSANKTFVGFSGSRSSKVIALDCNLCGIMEGVLTVDDFVPYDGGYMTADLPETVYGGTLDWTTGLLTVTHDCIESYAGEAVPDGWISSTGELSEGAQVVYPLSVPRSVQLSPQQLEMLKGSTAIWSSTGDTDVQYVADTKLYIDNALAAIAASFLNV